jgi:CheY-like chemotaxis protein
MSTILAVDDSATMRKCLEITFSGSDLKLISCDSRAAALEQVKAHKPGLVIVDASLQPVDGYDLCATLKLGAPGVPVLLLTSKQHPFDAARGAGVDEHVDKPFDTQALYDLVKTMIERAVAGTGVPDTMGERGASSPLPRQPIAAPTSGTHPSNAPPRKQPTPSMLAAMREPPAPGRGASELARRTVPFAVPPIGSQPLGKTSPGFASDPALAAKPAQDLGKTMDYGDAADPSAATPSPGPARPQPPPEARIGGSPESSHEGPAAAPETPRATFPDIRPREFQEPDLGSLPAPPPLESERPIDSSVPRTERPRRATASWPAPPEVLEAVRGHGSFAGRLEGLGLTAAQIEAVLALSRDVVEQVVWEVVPTLAETIIKEELRRLTDE